MVSHFRHSELLNPHTFTLHRPLSRNGENDTARKTHKKSCFCGLKAAIRKSGTAENLDRLFRACPRYRMSVKGSHCNYFKWVDDDEYERVGEGGIKKDYGAELQVDGDYDEWRLKIKTTELNSNVPKNSESLLQIHFNTNQSHLSVFLGGLKPGVGTKVIKLASFLVVAELVPLIVSVDIATGGATVGLGEDCTLAFPLMTFNLGGLAMTCSYIN
ncbi:hypothetical protein Ahy_A01g000684 [Arachis hypogaea]|uniref:GRF-type domain-containing protein n=1 Tax=Arachis hypogaea TaxID=3818 RepID=A0A445EKW2_ARAHY|nr:hypothetical protein Ahy_A01g000684 [Arachis hypogaea]